MSGYELEFDPTLWSNQEILGCNCYAYAINNQVVPGTNTPYITLVMGHYYGYPYVIEHTNQFNQSDIEEAVYYDYLKYNTEFNTNLLFITNIDRDDICPSGTYKIALFLDNSGNDYHWYRQNSDGTWSHKLPGGTPSILDASGEIIYDPERCNGLYGHPSNYSVFVGYYAVTPWNGYYNS